MEPAENQVPHGRSLGRYVVYDEFAAGGMATVHFGRLRGEGGFSRTVAIKRLHATYARDPQLVSMLVEEARLAARIQHPNVVAPLDVVAVDDRELLLVMEYIHGEALSRLLGSCARRSARVPTPVAVGIMTGLLYGLHAAHEAVSDQGQPLHIVHRDVSPQNVLVGTDGSARVLDFGVAKATSRSGATAPGTTKGKLSYMSPEQLRFKGVDRRADVFAAGVVLWEMLTLRRLFRNEDPSLVAMKILKSDVPMPSRFNPHIPAELDAVVARALVREREGRYESALTFAKALEETLTPASAREVGEWVLGTAQDSLTQRARLKARVESMAVRDDGMEKLPSAPEPEPEEESVTVRARPTGERPVLAAQTDSDDITAAAGGLETPGPELAPSAWPGVAAPAPALPTPPLVTAPSPLLPALPPVAPSPAPLLPPPSLQPPASPVTPRKRPSEERPVVAAPSPASPASPVTPRKRPSEERPVVTWPPPAPAFTAPAPVVPAPPVGPRKRPSEERPVVSWPPAAAPAPSSPSSSSLSSPVGPRKRPSEERPVVSWPPAAAPAPSSPSSSSLSSPVSPRKRPSEERPAVSWPPAGAPAPSAASSSSLSSPVSPRKRPSEERPAVSWPPVAAPAPSSPSSSLAPPVIPRARTTQERPVVSWPPAAPLSSSLAPPVIPRVRTTGSRAAVPPPPGVPAPSSIPWATGERLGVLPPPRLAPPEPPTLVVLGPPPMLAESMREPAPSPEPAAADVIASVELATASPTPPPRWNETRRVRPWRRLPPRTWGIVGAVGVIAVLVLAALLPGRQKSGPPTTAAVPAVPRPAPAPPPTRAAAVPQVESLPGPAPIAGPPAPPVTPPVTPPAAAVPPPTAAASAPTAAPEPPVSRPEGRPSGGRLRALTAKLSAPSKLPGASRAAIDDSEPEVVLEGDVGRPAARERPVGPNRRWRARNKAGVGAFSQSNCAPPYVLDERGIRRIKPECLASP